MLASALSLGFRRDPITRAMISDVVTYLPGDLLVKVDLASMAHSLECRGPFLDHRVVELAMAMPLDRKLQLRPGRSKVILKQAFSDLLPPAIKTRAKMGFGVPISRWFRKELKSELEEVLLDPVCLNRGIFRPAAIEKLVAEHCHGRREHSHRLWALLMLELWFRQYIDSSTLPQTACQGIRIIDDEIMPMVRRDDQERLVPVAVSFNPADHDSGGLFAAINCTDGVVEIIGVKRKIDIARLDKEGKGPARLAVENDEGCLGHLSERRLFIPVG